MDGIKVYKEKVYKDFICKQVEHDEIYYGDSRTRVVKVRRWRIYFSDGFYSPSDIYFHSFLECKKFIDKMNITADGYELKPSEFKVGDAVKFDNMMAVITGIHINNGGFNYEYFYEPNMKGDKVKRMATAQTCETPVLATSEEIDRWNKEVLEPNHLHYSKSERKVKSKPGNYLLLEDYPSIGVQKYLCFNQRGFKNVYCKLHNISDEERSASKSENEKIPKCVRDNYPQNYPCYVIGNTFQIGETGWNGYEIRDPLQGELMAIYQRFFPDLTKGIND